MRVLTYSEARQRLSEVLDAARRGEVIIKSRGGDAFSVVYKQAAKSPFDVPGVETKATTQDILDAVRESRPRSAGPAVPRRHRNRRA